MKLGQGTVSLTNLAHLGIVVRDVEKTAELISSIWNIGTPEVFDYSPTNELVGGKPFAGKPFAMRVAFIKFGTIMVELLQPLDRNSLYYDFIKTKGEGIHHIAWGVSNYDEMVAKFKKQGHKLLIEATYKGERWCYFDVNPGGMVLEFREEYRKI
ncbi:MAG: VOC family protein [Dehalococcoidia bacterium]|nr:VOC family protein [Dehalococcoidia bacterium]